MAIDSTNRQTSVDGLLRWIGDLDHPFYNDERQRFVWYEASAVGFQLGLFLQLTIGALAVLIAPESSGLLEALISVPVLLAACVVVVYSTGKGASFVATGADLRRPRLYLFVLPVVLAAIAIARFASQHIPSGEGDGKGLSTLVIVLALFGFVAGIWAGIWGRTNLTRDEPVVAAAVARRPPAGSKMDRVLRWIGDLDHPFYNEERQRFVWYEASAIGFQLMLVLQFAVAGIALVVGGLDAVPAMVIGVVPMIVTALVVMGYAHRRGARYFPKAQDLQRSRGLFGVALLALWLVAMLRLALDTPANDSGFVAGFSNGAPIGFAAGIIAAVATGWLASRREAE